MNAIKWKIAPRGTYHVGAALKERIVLFFSQRSSRSSDAGLSSKLTKLPKNRENISSESLHTFNLTRDSIYSQNPKSMNYIRSVQVCGFKRI